MRDIVHTQDPVKVSFIVALLKEAGIDAHVADENMSVTGSFLAFPRRIQVSDDQAAAACEVLLEADMKDEIKAETLEWLANSR
jgi:hypothetical protein